MGTNDDILFDKNSFEIFFDDVIFDLPKECVNA